MNANVAEQLALIARLWRRRRALQCAGLGVATLLSCLVAVALADWMIQARAGTPARWLATLSLGAAALLVAVVAVRAARRRCRAGDVAARIERLQPELGSLLTSGYEFAGSEPDDPRAGSVELRRSVVVRATATLAGLDADAAQPHPHWRRGVYAALAAIGTAAALCLVAGPMTRSAVVRLANPTSAVEWPRTHKLVFRDAPTLLPRGGEFVATLVDGHGELPAEIVFEHRPLGSSGGEAAAVRYRSSGARQTIRVANVQQPFEYRARGGDDQRMAWRRVDVAPAPTIADLRSTISPPSYTGWQKYAADRELVVLAGSTAMLRGRLSETAVALELVGEAAASERQRFTAKLDASGREFTASLPKLTAARQGTYLWRVVTRRGMHAQLAEFLETTVLVDRPPRGGLTAAGEKPLSVLPTAILPLSWAADDDVRIDALELEVVDAAGAEGVPSGPRHRQSVELPERELPQSPGDMDRGDQAAGQLTLPIDALGANADDRFAVRLRVTDALGQLNSDSLPLAIRIVSRDELLDELGRALAELREVLAAAESTQIDARRVATSLADPQLGVAGVDRREPPVASAPPNLAHVASRQRAVHELLLASKTGAAALARVTHQRYAMNGMATEPAARQLASLGETLREPTATLLAKIDEQLTTLQFAGGNEKPPVAAINSIAELQQTVIEILGAEIRALDHWASMQQLERELAALAERQRREQRATVELAREALAGAALDERRHRQRTAEQRDLAFRLAETLDRFEAAAARLERNQPTDAQQLRKIVALADDWDVPSLAAAAGEELAAAHWSAATEAQGRVADLLERLVAEFARWDVAAAQKRLQQLAKARRDAGELARDVAALQKADSQDTVNPASQQQKNDAAQRAGQKVRELAKRTEPLAPAAAKDAADAARKLDEPNSPNRANEAAKKLQEAQRKLAEAEEEQRQLTAEMKLARLAGEVDELLKGEREVASRIDAMLSASNRSPLIARQQELRQAAEESAAQVSEMTTLAYVLQSTATDMGTVAGNLERREPAAAAARRATRKLEQLALAIAEQRRLSRSAGSPNSNPAESPEENRARRQQKSLAAAVAQLRLLRDMQADLHKRTAQLEQASERADAANHELGELQRQQQELAELTRETATGANKGTRTEDEGTAD